MLQTEVSHQHWDFQILMPLKCCCMDLETESENPESWLVCYMLLYFHMFCYVFVFRIAKFHSGDALKSKAILNLLMPL